MNRLACVGAVLALPKSEAVHVHNIGIPRHHSLGDATADIRPGPRSGRSVSAHHILHAVTSPLLVSMEPLDHVNDVNAGRKECIAPA
jgi:hypothetical protein